MIINKGDILPIREFNPDNVQLFLYNAALWNAHRIHFDYPYTTKIENYPNLVIAGPLLGDWLNQCVNDYLGEVGRIVSIEYSNRKPAYIGDILYSGGKVTAYNNKNGEIMIDVYIKNVKEEIVTPGKVLAQLYVY